MTPAKNKWACERDKLARVCARERVRLTWRPRAKPESSRPSEGQSVLWRPKLKNETLCGASVVSMVTASLPQLRTRFAHQGRFKRISFSFFQARLDRLQQEAQIF